MLVLDSDFILVNFSSIFLYLRNARLQFIVLSDEIFFYRFSSFEAELK